MYGRFHVVDDDKDDVDGGWSAVAPSPLGQPQHEGAEAITEILTALIQCEHVAVVAGLGTSLAIQNDRGESLFPTMGGLWCSVEEAADNAPEVRSLVKYDAAANGSNIELLLSRCQLALELGIDEAPTVRAFVQLAESVIKDKCGAAPPSESLGLHDSFLLRLLQRSPRRPRLDLFTTNYDLCFELAAARIRATVVDGFSFAPPHAFVTELFDHDVVRRQAGHREPEYAQNLLRLYKLHGSVDWMKTTDGICRVRDATQPILIYPRGTKYELTYTQPFLEMMGRFQTVLRAHDVTVLAVGCGFNDAHLAEPILAAVKSNASLRLIVVAPDLSPAGAQAVHGDSNKSMVAGNRWLRQLNHLVDNGDRRITLLNATFQELVRLMPMMPAKSQAEMHDARIRRLEELIDNDEPA